LRAASGRQSGKSKSSLCGNRSEVSEIMTNQILLRASNIDKSYAGVHALRNASFELRSGEVHALIGENGAGKSTLIKVLTGAVIPDSGEISLDGGQILENSPSIS